MDEYLEGMDDYLKYYLKETKYLININNHFEFIVCDIWDRKKLFLICSNAVNVEDYIKRFEILYKLIEVFLKNLEDSKFKNINNFIIPIKFVFNILEVKNSFNYYKNFIRRCHGIIKKNSDKKILDLYDKNIKCLKIFFSKIIIEDDIKKLNLLLSRNLSLQFYSKKRLYLKEEYVLKLCKNIIKLEPKSSSNGKIIYPLI